jgi:hypothetical protein
MALVVAAVSPVDLGVTTRVSSIDEHVIQALGSQHTLDPAVEELG